MEQATFGEIVCSHWLRRVTCRSVSFHIGPVRNTSFVSHSCLQKNNEKEL